MIPIIEYAERAERMQAILSRAASFDEAVEQSVRSILAAVRAGGDAALRDLTEKFDGVRPEALRVPPEAIAEALAALDPALRAVLEAAAANIRRFHERQRQNSWFTDDGDGVVLGQRIVPIERVGLYVPGGQAFYPSSVLMNAIPAQTAGVPELCIVSPPQPDGRPHPLVLATAGYLGIETVYAVGGAQAVAALAYGTETIPQVDKIVGPGNAYVAAAKKQVFGRVAIDSIAGPTEIVVYADASARADFVAADLVAQAEHDARASAILVTTSPRLAEETAAAVARLAEGHPRAGILAASLAEYSALVTAPGEAEALALVNELAAEHLVLMVDDPWRLLPHIRHAGAVFMGHYSAEPVGDYFAGPNHVLPTGGTARYASALGVEDFVRRQSLIAYTAERLRRTAPAIAAFARAEALPGHAHAVEVRLQAAKAPAEGAL